MWLSSALRESGVFAVIVCVCVCVCFIEEISSTMRKYSKSIKQMREEEGREKKTQVQTIKTTKRERLEARKVIKLKHKVKH